MQIWKKHYEGCWDCMVGNLELVSIGFLSPYRGEEMTGRMAPRVFEDFFMVDFALVRGIGA